MQPVKLQHRVMLHTVDRVPDATGGFEERWQPLHMLWAELKPTSWVPTHVAVFSQQLRKQVYQLILRKHSSLGSYVHITWQGYRFRPLTMLQQHRKQHFVDCYLIQEGKAAHE